MKALSPFKGGLGGSKNVQPSAELVLRTYNDIPVVALVLEYLVLDKTENYF
jgi:hypothetical protein